MPRPRPPARRYRCLVGSVELIEQILDGVGDVGGNDEGVIIEAVGDTTGGENRAELAAFGLTPVVNVKLLFGFCIILIVIASFVIANVIVIVIESVKQLLDTLGIVGGDDQIITHPVVANSRGDECLDKFDTLVDAPLFEVESRIEPGTARHC